MVTDSNFLSLHSLFHYLQNGECDGCLLRSIQWRHYQRVKDEDTTLPLQRHVQSRRPTLKQISVSILSSSNVHRNISFIWAWPFNTEWLYIVLMKSNQCNYTADRKWINQGTDKWNTLHSETLKMLRSQHSTALRALNHYKFHMSVLINKLISYLMNELISQIYIAV